MASKHCNIDGRRVWTARRLFINKPYCGCARGVSGCARGVIVIVVGNEHGETSSNSGRD